MMHQSSIAAIVTVTVSDLIIFLNKNSFIRMHFKHSLEAFYHLIGAADGSQNQVHAQNSCTSEDRPSLHEWRGLHARLAALKKSATFIVMCNRVYS